VKKVKFTDPLLPLVLAHPLLKRSGVAQLDAVHEHRPGVALACGVAHVTV